MMLKTYYDSIYFTFDFSSKLLSSPTACYVILLIIVGQKSINLFKFFASFLCLKTIIIENFMSLKIICTKYIKAKDEQRGF